MLQTSQRIAALEPDDYLEVHVTGKRGSGKSTYAWQVCAETLKLMHPEWKKGPEYYLEYVFANHLVHGLGELIDKIDAYSDAVEPEDRLDILWWDDATVHGSSLTYFYDLESYIELQGLWDTVRSATSCIILTCPEERKLPKFVKTAEGVLKIKVSKWGARPWRQAKAYEKYSLPISENPRGSPVYIDKFRAPDGTETSSIPRPLYKRFRKRRAQYAADRSHKLKARIALQEQKEAAEMAKMAAETEKAKAEAAKYKKQAAELMAEVEVSA